MQGRDGGGAALLMRGMNIMKTGLPWGRAFASLLLGAALAGFTLVAGAATYYARVATGDWNVAATWSTVAPGGAAAATVPGAADDVVIERFSTTSPQITIPAAYAANAKTLRIGNNGQAGGVSLTFAAATSSLTMASDVTVFPPNNATTNALNVNAGTMTAPTKLTLETGTGTARLQITTGTVTVTDNLELKGAAAANNVIDMTGGAGTLYISNLITVTIATFNAGTTSTVNYNRAGDQTVLFGGITYANLTLSGSGNKTPTGGTGTVVGNFTLSSGVTWRGNTNNPAANIAGNFTNNGTFNSGTGTYTFNGSAAQAITGTTGGTTTFSRLTLNNASGLSLTGTHNVTVSTLLTLTTGRITTNANILFISNGSAIASVGASDFVVGNLRKQFATGSDVTRVFEVGTEATGVRYAPVDIRFGSVGTAGTFTVSSTAGDHASIGTSTLDAAQSVNRYWTLTRDTVAFTAHANNRIIFTFVAGDLDAGADTTTFYVSQFVSPNWTELTPSARTATTTTISGTGITTANISGDHQIGERGPAVPTPGSFNVFEASTGAGQITGVIKTKIAGSAFSLDVVAISSGAQLNGFTAEVTVELLGNNTLGVSLDANNCPTSSTTVQTVSPNPTITSGRSTVSFAAVANSWRDVRVRVRYPTTSPTVTSCSTDNFAIRPNTFANFSVSDTDWQTAGTGRTLNDVTFGAVTHKAGRPLSARATAQNASGATTTNYTGTPSATLSSCAGAACTSGFGTFTLGAAFAAGALASDVASYDNVGSLRLQLVDSAFASVDAADGSTSAERNIASSTIDAGRFVPDHFAVSLNTPALGTACGSFTYIGQGFNYSTAPVITVTAQGFANNTTTLYTGSWWRITNASLTGKAYSAATGTLDTAGLPGTDPLIAESGGAVGTLTFGSGTGLAFTRTTPVAPFDAEIGLAINVIDADSVAYASNPARFGLASASNGIAFSAGKAARFGRLVLRNANGSQLVPLPVQVEAQYWGYTNPPTNTVLDFITNGADNCTAIANDNLAMSAFAGNLVACETAVSEAGTLSAGRRMLLLAAPGSANDGGVTLTANLGAAASGTTCTTVGGAAVPAAGANRAYLQGNWSGANYDQNPAARATFGVFKGAEEVIFIRENF
jgi:hypothetical protein